MIRAVHFFTTACADMFVSVTIQRIFVFLPFCKMKVPFSCWFLSSDYQLNEVKDQLSFFFPEIIVSLKKKKSSTSLQEGYKRKRVVSIPYLWCSKTGSSLSREWVAGSVARHKCYTPSLSYLNAHHNDYVTSFLFICSAVNDITLIWSSSSPIHPYLAAQTNY